jgi:tetratricopeptide (TPR) repeat protein
MAASEFVARLREQAGERDRHYVFWLGAGCSVTSGIPAAGALVREQWLPRLQRIKDASGDIDQWATTLYPDYERDNPGAHYGNLIADLFPVAEDRQRETERLCDGRTPGFGYAVLAALMSRDDAILGTALTTNFDDMVADAMYVFGGSRPLVIQHESLAGFARPGRVQRPLVVKVHGDHRLEPRHTAQDTEALQEGVAEGIRGILHDRGVIFVGYAGNDAGVIETLESLPPRALPLGVWWVSKTEPSSKILPWLESRDAFWIQADGFDELMLLFRERFEIPHPTVAKFDAMIAGYRRTYQSLSDLIKQLPDSNHEASALKQAARTATADAKDWWGIDLAAHAAMDTDVHLADVIYREGVDRFEDPRLIHNYALFLKNELGDADRAEPYYKRALDADPDDPDYLNNYAVFLTDQRGEGERAEELFGRVIATHPDYAPAWGNRARLYFELSRDAEALADISKAMELTAKVDDPSLKAELFMYLLAVGPKEGRDHALARLVGLVRDGARSRHWNFSRILARAREEGREDIEWLEKLADVIAERAVIEVLDGWEAWRR